MSTMMPGSGMEGLLQNFANRIRDLESREAEREAYNLNLWTLREDDDSGLLLATTEAGDRVVLAGDPGGNPDDEGSPEAVDPGDGGGGGGGDCDCPPGPQGPPGETGPQGESGSFSAVWSEYVPTWTATGGGNAVGNGTLRGRYIRADDIVFYHIRFEWGTTTANGTGNYRFELPPDATPAVADPAAMGGATLRNDSTPENRTRGVIYAVDLPDRVSMVDQAGVVVAATVPWVWAVGDIIDIMGTYEAA